MLEADKDTKLLSYYLDSKAKLPVETNLKGDSKIRFHKAGEEPPTVGRDSATVTIYVRNEHNYGIELKPITKDPDLIITKFPAFLDPDQIGKVELTFKPSAERIIPLDNAAWDFAKIVYTKEDQPQA